MAFLKETEKSLRTYFLLFGAIGALVGLAQVNDYQELSAFGLPAKWTTAILLQIVTTTAIGIGYFIAGIKLKSALLTGAGWIKTMLYVSLGLIVVNAIYVHSALGSELAGGTVPRAVVGGLLTLYLISNVRRLSHEAQNPGPHRVA